MIKNESFDTHGDDGANDRMVNFINNEIGYYDHVLAGIWDEGSSKLRDSGIAALQTIGMGIPNSFTIRHRDGFLLIGGKYSRTNGYAISDKADAGHGGVSMRRCV